MVEGSPCEAEKRKKAGSRGKRIALAGPQPYLIHIENLADERHHRIDGNIPANLIVCNSPAFHAELCRELLLCEIQAFPQVFDAFIHNGHPFHGKGIITPVPAEVKIKMQHTHKTGLTIVILWPIIATETQRR